DDLLDALRLQGREILGPVVTDGAIVTAPIGSAAELPFGWQTSPSPGRVRLTRRSPADPRAGRAFDHTTSWSGMKPLTFPARVAALSFEPDPEGRLTVRVEAPAGAPTAIIGARACDLAALAVHDRVLLGGPAVDPDYAARRSDLFVVAVECALAGATCFCTSMGTGPEVTSGADVILSELDDGFVARAGSPAGERLLASLDLRAATPGQVGTAAAQIAATRAAMPLSVVTDGLPERLLANLDHPRWDEVAERCLACGNCTLVCPTCFCTAPTIRSDLDGVASTVERRWDSCFTEGFSQVAGGNFRPEHRDRYRQWLTHKFGTWWEQFGSSGCVGCGRCIAWCPVGIDVREELAIIAARVSERGPTQPASPPWVPIPPTPPGALLPTDYIPVTIVDVKQETADTATLRIATDDVGLLATQPGQFAMVGQTAFANPPVSVSRISPDGLELTIRAAGPATTALTKLRPGAEIALRGPLGRPWPIEDAIGRDVVIVAGGIGLAPIRGLLDAILARRSSFGAIRLYLGARTPRDRLFTDEIDALAARDDVLVRVTVDRAGPDWLGRVGIVTQLFKTVAGSGANVTAFICGPERMMTATADRLGDLGVAAEHTWLTLERHMDCGVGLCGHCQLGTRFVCRDGPVFSVAELGDDLRREGR
ncbi:MAG: 4Fe-4S dicluster domain-containing protein, partial [Chloroflexota bacterium]